MVSHYKPSILGVPLFLEIPLYLSYITDTPKKTYIYESAPLIFTNLMENLNVRMDTQKQGKSATWLVLFHSPLVAETLGSSVSWISEFHELQPLLGKTWNATTVVTNVKKSEIDGKQLVKRPFQKSLRIFVVCPMCHVSVFMFFFFCHGFR